MDKFYFKCGLLALLDDLMKINFELMHDKDLTLDQQTLLIELFTQHQRLFRINNLKK